MRVLVADDHALFRDGIISLMQAAGFTIVAQVGNGHAAVEKAMQLQPDLVLMDISMPGMNGLDALREIKAKQPNTQVVMLTVSEDDADLFEAMNSGARGYLLKDMKAEDFLEMIKGLETGEIAISRKTIALLIDSFMDPSRREAVQEDLLSAREVEILRLVADGMTNKSIAHSLGISENTVKYHIKNILRKMQVNNRTEAVKSAMQTGIL